jgi:hypothetical protein
VAALVFGIGADRDEDRDAACLLPIAGQPLIEYQLRAVHAAGAKHLLLLTSRMPPALLRSLNGLQRAGIDVDIVQTAAEAADHVHPQERVIILASGTVAAPVLIADLLVAGEPRLITFAGDYRDSATERIDAHECWAGVAVLSGDMIRQTAAALGEWDFCSTLLRRAVQMNVTRAPLDIDARPTPLIAQIRQPDDARQFDRQLIANAPPVHSGMLDQFIWSPLTILALPVLLRRCVDPAWFSALSGLLTLLTLAIAVFGVWRATPAAAATLFLLAGFATLVASRLRTLSLQAAGRLRRLSQARMATGGAALLLITRQMLDYGFNWGYFVLSMWTLVEMVRLSQIDPWFTARNDLPFWRATPDMAALIMLIAVCAKLPLIGLEVMTVYTVITSLILLHPKRS